jgi:hypothetical protein
MNESVSDVIRRLNEAQPPKLPAYKFIHNMDGNKYVLIVTDKKIVSAINRMPASLDTHMALSRIRGRTPAIRAFIQAVRGAYPDGEQAILWALRRVTNDNKWSVK